MTWNDGPAKGGAMPGFGSYVFFLVRRHGELVFGPDWNDPEFDPTLVVAWVYMRDVIADYERRA